MNVEKIREDFPVLSQKVNGKPIIYMDSACMSLKPRQVVGACNEYYEKFTGCAGRSSHSFARQVTERVEGARKAIAGFFNAKKPGEIVFTKNTTESINLIANSLELNPGDMVMTTDKEHNSNLLPWQMLADVGVKHEVVKSTDEGKFDLEGFEQQICNEVKLVSMVHTSNLDGTTIPAGEVIKIAHDYGALVLLDAAQSAPHNQIDVRKLDADFLACSGHKMLGPTGVGVLYGKYGLLEELDPFMVGGQTVERSTYESCVFLKPPEKFEAGLQNYAGIIGMEAAVRYLQKIGLDSIERHEADLNLRITEGMKGIRGASILGPEAPGLRGGIVPFSIKGMKPHDIALMLDSNANIMVRSGQHCVHSWFAARGMDGSVRASLYLYNTREEADMFLEKLADIAKLAR